MRFFAVITVFALLVFAGCGGGEVLFLNQDSAGGGGGSGGTILIAASNSPFISFETNGGRGETRTLSGGNGAQGVIYFQTPETAVCAPRIFTRDQVRNTVIVLSNGSLVPAISEKGLLLHDAIGKGTFLMNRSSLTLSAWINLKEYSKGNPSLSHSTIIAQWGNINLGNAAYGLTIEPTGKVRFEVSKHGNDETRAISDSSVSLNTWHHVAGRYNGTTLQIFVDGIPDGASTAFTGLIFNTSIQFSLGAHEAPGLLGFFNGALDEIRIYNRALSDDDIAVLGNRSVRAAISNSFYHLHIHNNGSCAPDMIFPLNASDPDDEEPTFQFIPELPHTITNEEAIASRNEGIGITVQVNDSGNLVDWQRVVVQVR